VEGSGSGDIKIENERDALGRHHPARRHLPVPQRCSKSVFQSSFSFLERLGDRVDDGSFEGFCDEGTEVESYSCERGRAIVELGEEGGESRGIFDERDVGFEEG